jgi:hypothetical protein
MKKIAYIYFLAILLVSCVKKHNYTVLPFKNNPSVSDIYGIPRDSMTSYFPDSLFYETKAHEFDSIEFDYKVKRRSYLLYKMNEPILSNYFLNKEIYRITIIRAFGKPIVIRVDKDKDGILIEVKKINRNITYPFFRSSSQPIYATEMTTKERHELDSIGDANRKKYNNANYHIESYYKFPLNQVTWDSLTVLLDSAHFWTTKPRTDFKHYQIDGSTWILEGHNKYGYQIKIIPSPRLDLNKRFMNFNELDSTDTYADIFRYILLHSKIKAEEFY